MTFSTHKQKISKKSLFCGILPKICMTCTFRWEHKILFVIDSAHMESDWQCTYGSKK